MYFSFIVVIPSKHVANNILWLDKRAIVNKEYLSLPVNLSCEWQENAYNYFPGYNLKRNSFLLRQNMTTTLSIMYWKNENRTL